MRMQTDWNLDQSDMVNLEAQTSEVVVHVSKSRHDSILDEASRDPGVIAGRRSIVVSPPLLTSTHAFDPSITASALILTWKNTRTPLFLLSCLFAVFSVLVGVIAGSMARSLDTGIKSAGCAANILTFISVFVVKLH